jgi:RND family efflux transporter MFP subunit
MDAPPRPSPPSLTPLTLLTLLPLAALLGCGGDGPVAERRGAGAPPAVEAVPARTGTLPLEERVSGVVKAWNQVAIRPEIEGRVVAVLARSGDAVERGQPLVRLDAVRLSEQLRQAEAAVRLAEAAAAEARAQVAELVARVTRSRALAAEELVSAVELETQEARLAAAEASAAQAAARVEEARASAEERRDAIGKAVVRSPVDGRLGRRNAEVGMRVDPSTVLFVAGDLDRLIVEVPLTEEMLGRLREGQRVRLTSDALAEPVEGTLARIPPFLETGSFSTVGEIDVDNRDGRLRPGMFVAADVLYGESERATLVPSSAVWEDPRTGVSGVFVVADDLASDDHAGDDLGDSSGSGAEPEPLTEPREVTFRAVEVLAEGRGTVGLRGVEAGEWVVTVGQQLLAADGPSKARVRVASWERVLELQGLQREDLLAGFLEKQQRLARTRGAEPPEDLELLGSSPETGLLPGGR